MPPRPGFIHPTAEIGNPPEHREWTLKDGDKGVQIAPTAQINAFCTVDAGHEHPTRIGHGAWLLAHTHIGHDAEIGAGCELAPGTVIGGHVVLEPGVRCGIGVLVRNRVRVGRGARIGAGAVVVKDVPPGEIWVGNPAKKIVK